MFKTPIRRHLDNSVIAVRGCIRLPLWGSIPPLTPIAKRDIKPNSNRMWNKVRVWRGCRVAEGPALEKRYPVYPGSWVRIPPSPPYFVRSPDKECVGAFPFIAVDGFKPCGEMSELAEGARLEIVCVVYSGTEGSNPSLSATPFFPFTSFSLSTASNCLLRQPK